MKRFSGSWANTEHSEEARGQSGRDRRQDTQKSWAMESARWSWRRPPDTCMISGTVSTGSDHAHSGAILAYQILYRETDMPLPGHSWRLRRRSAITTRRREQQWMRYPAALILADKTDVRRNRVQNPVRGQSFDIHDRVNYAALIVQVDYSQRKGYDTDGPGA